MNGILKSFLCSLLFYLCVASPSLSADVTKQSKEINVKPASEQKQEGVVKAGSEQKKDAANASSEQNKDGLKSASVFFPEPAYQFDSAVDGSDVLHDFVIMNKGTDILKVEKVKTG
ncbi:MAG: hypothetical protein HQK72_04815 [Desulfamplus sp.]|nr:hypothetical protein [Desulfamplus sp.]